MYLIATGEAPFRNRQCDANLIREIMDGLRPLMPVSAPEEYKKLAERCCDADPNKHPDAFKLLDDIIICTVTTLSVTHGILSIIMITRLVKESKYSRTYWRFA